MTAAVLALLFLSARNNLPTFLSHVPTSGIIVLDQVKQYRTISTMHNWEPMHHSFEPSEYPSFHNNSISPHYFSLHSPLPTISSFSSLSISPVFLFKQALIWFLSYPLPYCTSFLATIFLCIYHPIPILLSLYNSSIILKTYNNC